MIPPQEREVPGGRRHAVRAQPGVGEEEASAVAPCHLTAARHPAETNERRGFLLGHFAQVVSSQCGARPLLDAAVGYCVESTSTKKKGLKRSFWLPLLSLRFQHPDSLPLSPSTSSSLWQQTHCPWGNATDSKFSLGVHVVRRGGIFYFFLKCVCACVRVCTKRRQVSGSKNAHGTAVKTLSRNKNISLPRRKSWDLECLKDSIATWKVQGIMCYLKGY